MASVHRRSSGNYQVRWREGRANRSRTFKTRDEARRWQGMVERSEVATPRPGEVPTLMEYADAWLATRTDLAETTRVQYDRWLTFHIYPELAHTPVNELTGQRIQGWQDRRLAEGAGYNSILIAGRYQLGPQECWRSLTIVEDQGLNNSTRF